MRAWRGVLFVGHCNMFLLGDPDIPPTKPPPSYGPGVPCYKCANAASLGTPVIHPTKPRPSSGPGVPCCQCANAASLGDLAIPLTLPLPPSRPSVPCAARATRLSLQLCRFLHPGMACINVASVFPGDPAIPPTMPPPTSGSCTLLTV